jgi:hypothetical protein
MPGEKHLIQYVPEPAGIRTAVVGWSAVGTLILLAISIGGLFGIYRMAVPRTPAPSEQTFPKPQVDTSEREEMHRLRDAQNKVLETWRWSDEQHSTVQIPIGRAMQLLAGKGDHAYDPLLPEQSAMAPPTAAAERTTIENRPAQTPNQQQPEPKP